VSGDDPRSTHVPGDDDGWPSDVHSHTPDVPHAWPSPDDPAATYAADTGFPWPPADGESIISAFGRTWHGAALQPSSFFARMPQRDSLGAALLYYLAIGIAVAGVQLFWVMITGAGAQPREVTAGSVDSALALNPLLNFFLSPLFLIGSLFLSAAVVHGMLKLLGGASQNYVYTVRLFCFAYSPQILGVAPRIGAFIGFVWMVVVAILGIRAGHNTTTGRAATAVLVPVILALILVAVIFLAAQAAGLFSMPV
jgi:hypothetical protein